LSNDKILEALINIASEIIYRDKARQNLLRRARLCVKMNDA